MRNPKKTNALLWTIQFLLAALPGVTKIQPRLTSIAAAGLVIIMIGATVITIGAGVFAVIPLATGVLCAIVAYGRWRVAPAAA